MSDTLKPIFHDGIRLVHADFHSLRHSGITFVVRAEGLRVGQVWAGHSTPVLTAKYAHVDQEELDRVEGVAGRFDATQASVGRYGGRLKSRTHGARTKCDLFEKKWE
jgi:hypothetical protein